ncbi:uncharacterized protein LOC123310324 [Coccinella septempunctata]|uniref:uncharacterized protein LOC123310324 n=1 Tax=Coccinella septempunctata TaxID=41139 RepID=UPI001D076FD3|nr:uncharacterized protein LOC123310324 [Coccinella septempunctata]
MAWPGIPSPSAIALEEGGTDDDHVAGNSSVAVLASEMRSMRMSVDFCSNKISDFEAKLARFDEVLSRMAKLENENTALKKEVSSLNMKINTLDQFSRSNNLEIQNVPEKSNENLIEIVSRIGSHLNVPVDVSSLDHVARVPTKLPNKPKNIVVRFISKIKRDNLLTAYKALQRSNSNNRAGITVKDVADGLFIGEHLTMQNKLLFKEARASARRKGYGFVWTQNGNILVRRNETSEIVQIADVSDIQKL